MKLRKSVFQFQTVPFRSVSFRSVPFRLGTSDFFHRCTLSFCIIIMNGPDRNGTEKQIDICGKSLMFTSRDLLFHFVEGPRGKG